MPIFQTISMFHKYGPPLSALVLSCSWAVSWFLLLLLLCWQRETAGGILWLWGQRSTVKPRIGFFVMGCLSPLRGILTLGWLAEAACSQCGIGPPSVMCTTAGYLAMPSHYVGFDSLQQIMLGSALEMKLRLRVLTFWPLFSCN